MKSKNWFRRLWEKTKCEFKVTFSGRKCALKITPAFGGVKPYAQIKNLKKA